MRGEGYPPEQPPKGETRLLDFDVDAVYISGCSLTGEYICRNEGGLAYTTDGQ